MNSVPAVSIIVASYNYEELVIETLECLWRQTFRDFEIVVVDDGSTDASVNRIRAFVTDHANGDVALRLLTHPAGGNHGLPATVELGVRESRGEYIAFCAADDLWTADHLAEIMKSVCSCGTRPELVVNDVELFGDPSRCSAKSIDCHLRWRLLSPGLNHVSPALFRDINPISTFSCVMTRRDSLLACDFCSIGRTSALDCWLWRQIAYEGAVLYVDRPLTRWRMHASQMVADHDSADYAARHHAFIVAGSQLLRRQHPLTSRWRLVRSDTRADGGWRKRLRTLLKHLAPYALECAYAERTYGIIFPRYPGCSWLPFGLVCRLKGLDPDNGFARAGTSRSCQPSYRLPCAKLAHMVRERNDGLSACADVLRRNQGVRIAVVLHLYYDAAWTVIAEYLRSLEPYGFDLVVTITEGRISEKTLAAIRSFSSNARILTCANHGFDLWPFARALRDLDLSRYDVVFKLHSKGITRPFLFMYGQVFKHWDWFLGLFDGILGGHSVHTAIDAIRSGAADLVAAEHLVVTDPLHKVSLVKEFCAARNLPYVDGYRFVAGTCFAARPSMLASFRELKLTEDDFTPSQRGEFSAAHALERWICFAAAGRIMGIPVEHVEYPLEVAHCAATSPLRLLNDSRFKLDADFFYRVLESRIVTGYDVVRIRLGDIRRKTNDGAFVPLTDCAPYRYLCGEQAAYEDYCRTNLERTGFAMSVKRFETLRHAMRDYDPSRMPVLSGDANVIIDGQHRCCILLATHGPDYEITALRLRFSGGTK